MLLTVLLSLLTSAAYAQPWAKMHDEDLMELRLSIGAYLLLDELQLSPEQKSDLVAVLDDFRQDQAEAETIMKEFHDSAKTEMTAVLENLKNGRGISEEDAVAMAGKRDKHFATMKSFKDKLDAHIAGIMEILSDEQSEKLRKFNPMARLDPHGKAPGGLFSFMEEMKDASGAEILEKIRSMSDEEFSSFKKEGCPVGDPAMEPGMGPGPDMAPGKGRGRGKDKGPGGRLMARFEKIRAMSDEEFQAKKDDLAAFIEKGREMRAKRSGKGFDGEPPMPFMGKAHQHMVRAIILSDGFYEALKSN